jgi:hypothetical protein
MVERKAELLRNPQRLNPAARGVKYHGGIANVGRVADGGPPHPKTPPLEQASYTRSKPL